MKRRARRRVFYRRQALLWHRRLGLAAAVLAMLLAVTGVLLNRTEALGLDRRFVDAEWLLGWYGVDAAAPEAGFAAGALHVSQAGGRIYLDSAAIAEAAAPLVGAVRSGPVVAAATEEAIYLFAPDGALVEKAVPVGVPRPLRGLAAGAGRALFLRAGGGAWAGDLDLSAWRPAGAAEGPADWPRAQPLPPDLAERIAESRRGAGLPWERVVLDLHSGRLFGAWGPLAMDAAAAALVLLALTGFYNWLARRR